MKFESKYENFHWIKCIWKCRLQMPLDLNSGLHRQNVAALSLIHGAHSAGHPKQLSYNEQTTVLPRLVVHPFSVLRGYMTFIFPYVSAWWRHQMEAFSALLALCARNSPVTSHIPQDLWDVITCPCSWYLLLAHKSPIVRMHCTYTYMSLERNDHNLMRM